MPRNVQRTASLRSQLLEALVTGDQKRAHSICKAARDDDMPPISIELHIVLPSIEDVGELWSRGEINLAVAQRASELVSEQLTRLRDECVPHPPLGLRAVTTAVEGGLHTLSARVAADILYCNGWQTDYLGGNLPTLDLVEFVQQNQVDLVVLSLLVHECTPRALQAIRSLHALEPAPKVIVGGTAVAEPNGRARLSEADALVDDLDTLMQAVHDVCGIENHMSLEVYLQRIGRRILEWRQHFGWNQAMLAERAGLDRSYISALERGKQNVTVAALLKTANALRITLEDLVSDVHDTTPPAT